MAWLVVWLVALSFWHFGGHWSSFAHFTRYLGCDGFIRAFGGSAAWSVVSSVLRVAGSGWWLVPFVFPPFLVWGGCGFCGSLLGCGLLAVVCCGGRLLLPSAHALSTWGKVMDKVMMVHLTCHVTVVFHHCVKACQRLGVAFHGRSFAINIYSPVHVQLLLLWPCP